MSKIKLARVKEVQHANGGTALLYTDVRLPGLSRNAANILRVLGAFALLMGVILGGSYALHMISIDHWAWLAVVFGVVILAHGTTGLLGYACSKLTDEWGRK